VKTSQLVKELQITRDTLYYLEKKGFITPKKRKAGKKLIRDYSEVDVRKVELIWKYLKMGFKYEVAYEKALEQLNNPELGF
jgi:DNA-binding transcriptional MerR regulator